MTPAKFKFFDTEKKEFVHGSFFVGEYGNVFELDYMPGLTEIPHIKAVEWTGVVHESGAGIYEGDVLEGVRNSGEPIRGVIEFDLWAWRFKDFEDFGDAEPEDWSNMEHLGSSLAHPELLEGKE